MNKKQIYIILGTIIFFVIIILIILSSSKKNNWQKEILSSNNVQISMKDCNNREVELPKEILDNIFIYWNGLTDNGPWTGDQNTCYETLTITYEKEGVIQSINILLVTNTSLVLDINNTKRYYVNSLEVNTYLTNLFNTY